MITKQIQESAVKGVEAEGGSNRILFRASGMGNMDRHSDVICPGAFSAQVLESFLREGTILFNHDYKAEPIAIPMSAADTGRFLMIEADWHSTEFAAQKRIVAEERMAAGKQVGSSIGFYPEYKWFETGTDLLAWATGMGYDMSLFDASIAAHDDWCWAIPKVSALSENSLLGVLPANPAAEVVELKGLMAKLGDTEDGAIERKCDFLLGRENKAKGAGASQPDPGGKGLSIFDAQLRLAQAKTKR